jgi:hypothetical protein
MDILFQMSPLFLPMLVFITSHGVNHIDNNYNKLLVSIYGFLRYELIYFLDISAC